MSELGDGDHSGMTMAMSITLDLAELQPSARVLWQVVDPVWGLFNTGNSGEVVGVPFASYYVFAQFSRHVRQGCKIIADSTTSTVGNDDNATQAGLKNVVAYDASNRKLVIVTLNLDDARWITYDLSGLPAAGGPIQCWETTAIVDKDNKGLTSKAYKSIGGVELRKNKFRFRCDPNSVCTFEIQGVTL
jgi:galactan endo-1,6-beta-galactosidase